MSAITCRPMARLWQRVLRAKCFFIKQKHFKNASTGDNGYSVDCLAFSRWTILAAGGRTGQDLAAQADLPELIAIVENTSAWVDRLAWRSDSASTGI